MGDKHIPSHWTQFNDDDLFKEMSIGLKLIHENIYSLFNAAIGLCANKQYHPARVLGAIADEEVGKFLILLDVARCPKGSSFFSAQLKRFYDHLAKGIYAEVVNYRYNTVEECIKCITPLLEKYYIDGPDDTDWLYEKSIIRSREDSFYVDWKNSNEQSYWSTPLRYAKFFSPAETSAMSLVNSIYLAGLTKPESLRKISGKWRGIDINPSVTADFIRGNNYETLSILNNSNLLEDVEDRHYNEIVNLWPFPMYGIKFELMPTVIVRQYCNYDANGYRLNSRTIAHVKKLNIPNELSQPSDLAIIIQGYTINIVKKDDDKDSSEDANLIDAKIDVEVKFDVVGELDGLKFTLSTQKKELCIFNMQKNNFGWRIASFSGRSDPKIHAGAMADHLLRISAHEEDLDQRNELINLVKTLREYDCNPNSE